jgi:hypothetical protein
MVLTVLLATSLAARGMDRWAALSQIESGDNDRAVGRGGEISRYQIKPCLWNAGEPSDCMAALENAQHIMQVRLMDFEHRYGRSATDFEFYVLWNAPRQVVKPSRIVRERAERFANLCAAHDPSATPPAPFIGPPYLVPQTVALPPTATVTIQTTGAQPAMVVASRSN